MIKPFKKLLILIFVVHVSLLMGCSSDEISDMFWLPSLRWPPSSPNEKPYPYIKIEKESEAKVIVDNATIRCENEEDCPESAALLIGYDQVSVFQCSTTYIGNGYFTSNAHCVPNNLIQGLTFNADCSGSLWVKFPKTSLSEPATYECEKLIMVTSIDKNDLSLEARKKDERADMMIFKVKEQVDRKPLEINWDEQPGDGELVTLWPSDPDKNQPGLHGVIKRKTCEVSDIRNLTGILKDHSWNYPTSYLTNCSSDIVKGNSGATAFNENQQGILVLSHKMLFIYENGEKTNGGMGANYICSHKKLKNGEMLPNSRDCRLISDEFKSVWEEQQLLSEFNKIQDSMKEAFDKNNELFMTRIDSRVFYDLAQEYLSSEDIENLKKYLKNFHMADYFESINGDSIEVTSFNGRKYGIHTNDFKVSSVFLPSCIGPLSEETLETHRNDIPWFPDRKSYHPIKITFPLIRVITKKWEFIPKFINWYEFDNLHLKVKNSVTPVSTVFEIELSDFDVVSGEIKEPTIKITDINPNNTQSFTPSDSEKFQDSQFYTDVIAKLESLDICNVRDLQKEDTF